MPQHVLYGFVVFKPASTQFGDYQHCGSTHFIIGFAGIWHEREKNSKISERFQTLPSASERVRTHPERSEQVQNRLGTYENFEKLAKTSRKLRERRVRAVVVCPTHF